MAYGNMRAVQLDPKTLKQLNMKKGCLCMPCLDGLLQDFKVKLTPFNEEVYAGDAREMLSAESAVKYGMMLGVQSTYHEGQRGHQDYLDTHNCIKCGKLLRDDCTDY